MRTCEITLNQTQQIKNSNLFDWKAFQFEISFEFDQPSAAGTPDFFVIVVSAMLYDYFKTRTKKIDKSNCEKNRFFYFFLLFPLLYVVLGPFIFVLFFEYAKAILKLKCKNNASSLK